MKQLKDIAYGRSGDKGADANIGIIAYKEEHFLELQEKLTIDAVKQYFPDLPIERVERYELPHLWALNFVLIGALEGGGSRSLRSDSQGKGLAQYLLEMPWK